MSLAERISKSKIEGRFFLPTLRARDVVFLSLGVTLGIIAPIVGALLGDFEGWWYAVCGLFLFLLGLTPCLMEGLWERIRR